MFLALQASAFTTRKPAFSSSSTTLHLFGGGAKEGGEKKGPGMMDQLAMFKKAQEVAQKKKELDTELAKMDFQGTGADGKVKATFKYNPSTNPMDPNPEYEVKSFDFDDEFYSSSSPEEIADAVEAAIMDGIENTNKAVADKYEVLQTDLMEAFGQKGPE